MLPRSTMLVMTHAALATVEELFEYKAQGFELPPFAGYTADQWGVKAHNRPWIAAVGAWENGQRVIEVGGAYSRLPEWLGDQHEVEPWVGDDFGLAAGEREQWSRWGDPHELPGQHPSVTYVFKPFGAFSPQYPDRHFDRIFSVSTLEHISPHARLDVLRDINRCTAPGGRQLHTIDVPTALWKALAAGAAERAGLRRLLAQRYPNGIAGWLDLFRRSGVKIATRPPSSLRLLDRQTLVESPDVWFRFYPPAEQPKAYAPTASLLVVIEDR